MSKVARTSTEGSRYPLAELVGQMINTTVLRSIGTAVVLLVTSGCSLAQVPHTSPVPKTGNSKMAEQELVRESVRSFLSSWLVDRNLGKAMLSFAQAAFRNEAMLQEPCASYIKPEDRGSEVARRAGIDMFLRDFPPAIPSRSLGEILDHDTVSPVAEQLGNNLLNDPKVDQFAIAKLKTDELPNSESKEEAYLKEHLPPSFYVSFVPIARGMVYFLWVPEGDTWRIYHAALVCM